MSECFAYFDIRDSLTCRVESACRQWAKGATHVHSMCTLSTPIVRTKPTPMKHLKHISKRKEKKMFLSLMYTSCGSPLLLINSYYLSKNIYISKRKYRIEM